MVLDLVLIGVAITLTPLHNTGFILLLSAPSGIRKGLSFILAWLACLVALIGAVILFTDGRPPVHKSAPSTAVLAVKLLLGLGMVVYGERKWRRGSGPRQSPKWMARLTHLSGWTAAGLGVLLQPWGMVAAGTATVVQAHVSSVASYFALMGYCLLATSSLLVMELYATFRPAAAQSALGRLLGWIAAHQDQTVVTVTLALGLWLVSKSIYQLVG